MSRTIERCSRLLQMISHHGIKHVFQHLASVRGWSFGIQKGPQVILTPHAVHRLFFRPNTSDKLVFAQIFHEREYSCFDDLQGAGLIIDCGANVGYSSAYFLSRFPQSRVIAIEPDAENFQMLQKNLAPFGDRVKLIHGGIWSRSAGLVVDPNYRDGEHWSRTVRECKDGENPMVVAFDIPSILADSGEKKCSLLKVDIERSEVEVFSAKDLGWLDQIDNIAIELHDQECKDVFFKAIEGQGFEVSRSGELTICKKNSPKFQS